MEHKTEEFTKINPFQRVPVIDDNGFVLTESMSILKYLAMKYEVPDHWYPKDLQKQARIDEYLHWHHWNIRWNGSMYFMTRVVKPMISGKGVDKKKLDMYKDQLTECTGLFEKYFIGNTPYIFSQDVSIADIQALVEFMQPYAAGYDIFAERPALKAWRDRVKPRLEPYFEESHQFLYKLAKRLKEADQSAKL